MEVRQPDQTTQTKPFIIDTSCQHHGAVEPILYLSPSGKWVRRVSFAELPGLKPKPPFFIEITQPLATKWLWANGYPVPGCAAPVKANARIRDRRGPSPEQEYAHRLWHEGHLSQAEIAQEIQRLFHGKAWRCQICFYPYTSRPCVSCALARLSRRVFARCFWHKLCNLILDAVGTRGSFGHLSAPAHERLPSVISRKMRGPSFLMRMNSSCDTSHSPPWHRPLVPSSPGFSHP